MPIFGTSTEVNSLEQLQTLDSAARLSVQKKDGKDVLVATKGTLADGLYSLWAIFCPNQARQARIETLNALKKTIAAEFHVADDSIVLRPGNQEQTCTQQTQDTRLFTSEFKGENLKDYFDFTNVVPSKPLPNEAASDEIAPSDDPTATFSPLERALYKNQFCRETDKENYTRQQSLASKSNDLLSKIFQDEIKSEKKAPGILYNVSLPATSPTQYRTPTNSELESFKQLREAITTFEQKKFTGTKSDRYLLQQFERHLSNYLDQHPKISLTDLQAHLDKYLTPQPSNKPEKRESELINQEAIEEVRTIINANPRLFGGKTRLFLDQIETLSAYPNLSKQIAKTREQRDYQQFFDLLEKLSSKESKFFDYRLNKEVCLQQDEQTFFIDHLLSAFTIKKEANLSVYVFFTTLVPVLLKHLKSQDQSAQLTSPLADLIYTAKQSALSCLKSNKTNIEKNKKFSADIRKEVEAHRDKEEEYTLAWKKYREALKGNSQAQPPTIEKPTISYNDNKEVATEALLSQDAISLLAFAVLSLTPKTEQAATQAQLTKDFGITFDNARTSNPTEAPLLAASQNSAITTTEREILPLPTEGQEALKNLEQRLTELAAQNPSRDFLKLEKTKAEMNRRIDNLLRSNPTASLEDISSCIAKFENDLQNLIALDEARNPVTV